jgi:DinB family protein
MRPGPAASSQWTRTGTRFWSISTSELAARFHGQWSTETGCLCGPTRPLQRQRASKQASVSMTAIPDRTEAAEYYFTYIDQVPGGDIYEILRAQSAETCDLLKGIADDRSLYRYAPDKWSIRQVVSHVNDCERLFVFRALWFARGFDSPLPSFDQNVAVSTAGADERPLSSHVDEFRAVRAATLAFFETLPASAWARRGVASGNPFTVRALAYITAGHVTHHSTILRKRYLRR